MEVLDAIKTRRSIRHYKPDQVSDEALRQVLEAARWAPSWSNMQCWRFIIVRDGNTKLELAKSLVQVVKRPDGTVYNPAFNAISQAPVVIVVCAEMGRSGIHDGIADTDKGDWFMFDTALAIENLALAAHSLGLGTVITGALDAKKAATILGVPEGYCVVAITPLGFPARESKAPPRKELAEIVFYDRFGHRP